MSSNRNIDTTSYWRGSPAIDAALDTSSNMITFEEPATEPAVLKKYRCPGSHCQRVPLPFKCDQCKHDVFNEYHYTPVTSRLQILCQECMLLWLLGT